jgi:lysophospholipase L1-like esterase
MLACPRGPVSLKNAAEEIEYVEIEDYLIDAESGIVTRPPTSRIPAMTLDELYPSTDRSGSGFMHVRGDPTTFLLVDEEGRFHDRQVTISYAFDVARWAGFEPRDARSQLPRIFERLRRREPLIVCLLGDSIAAGYNASGSMGRAPFQPAFGDLVGRELEVEYGSHVTVQNLAVAGWTSDQGLDAVEQVSAARPNLVIIAFGMNDAGYADPRDYGANIRAMIAEIRLAVPGAEFVLVSSMLPNPEWHYPQLSRFDGYRDQLIDLCGAGVALADVTTLWKAVTARKSPYDLTGNGINHPNDFGHRLYAQAITALFT